MKFKDLKNFTNFIIPAKIANGLALIYFKCIRLDNNGINAQKKGAYAEDLKVDDDEEVVEVI